ncbi:MAG: hypothetical protein ACYDAQ_10195 [Mycobacteriales bacterium]
MVHVEQTHGQCRLCGKSFAKAGMTRHARACRGKLAGTGSADGLLVGLEDRYLPSYWLVLEVASRATWADLDGFLRGIWVECCGHLSCFNLYGATFTDYPEEESEWADDTHSSAEPIAATAAVGSRFSYEYDFGTTTELSGRVLATVPGGPAAHPIEVLARNEPPQYRCAECGRSAVTVCGLCYQGVDEPCWYCDTCRWRHRCSEPDGDYFLPVVNSPRVGLCGYGGPADG